MKLKKIVSLALAGVLAVSMLAGCNYDGAASSNGGASSEAPAATGLTGKIIAALDLDNVTFGTDASLQNSLEVLVANTAKKGTSLTALKGSDLVDDVNSTLGSKTKLSKVDPATACTKATDGTKQTYVFMVNTQGTVDEEFIVNQLVSKIESEEVANDNVVMADLPERSTPDSTTAASAKYQYEFKYTASVASTSAVDNNGQTTYLVAVVLTRTPTEVKYKG